MPAQTVSELYPRLWAKPEDLKGKPATLTICAASLESFRNRDGGTREAIVLSFERAQRRLILNKTQTLAIAEQLGDRFTDWPGHAITLAPGTAPNGKPTIVVLPPAQ